MPAPPSLPVPPSCSEVVLLIGSMEVKSEDTTLFCGEAGQKQKLGALLMGGRGKRGRRVQWKGLCWVGGVRGPL